MDSLVEGGCRKLHNEELHNFYSSPNIVRILSRGYSKVQTLAKHFHNFDCNQLATLDKELHSMLVIDQKMKDCMQPDGFQHMTTERQMPNTTVAMQHFTKEKMSTCRKSKLPLGFCIYPNLETAEYTTFQQ